MTSGSKDFSAPPVTTDTIVWTGEDDILKSRENTYQKTRTFKFNPKAPLIYKPTGESMSEYMGNRVWVWTSQDEVRLDADLSSRAAKKLRGHDFNLGVTLAELRQTIGTVGGAAKGIAGIFRKIDNSMSKRIRYSNQPTRQRYIQDKWLEYRYGWMPLLGDVYNAAEACASLLREPSDWVRVVAARSAPLRFYMDVSFIYGSATRSRAARFRLQGDLTIAQHFGLTDPLSIAWELIPYSFVVDWFVPIGDFLSTRSTLNQARSVECVLNSRFRLYVAGVPVNTPRYSGLHPYREATWSFSRERVSPSSLVPQFPPMIDLSKVFKGDLGVKRTLDAIALLGLTVTGLSVR